MIVKIVLDWISKERLFMRGIMSYYLREKEIRNERQENTGC